MNGYCDKCGTEKQNINGGMRNNNLEFTYDMIMDIKEFLVSQIQHHKPKVGIICGSGLGTMANAVTNAIIIEYNDIPNFPVSTVPGHAGKLIFGNVSGVPVVLMQGRFHYYEGYSLSTCCMPVRLMKLFGCSFLIASNAAGGLNPNFNVGDIMLQRDHFNIMGFAGNSPLIGFNDTRWGPRYFSMENCYDSDILKDAHEIAKQLGMQDQIKEGVYTCLGGPNYESVAELRVLKSWNIDAVGMSTVHEVTAARHVGMKCFAFSLITNICSTEYRSQGEATHEEVLDIGKSRQDALRILIENVVKVIGEKYL